MKKGLEKFYELVEAFESLPTIGKKSALRLAYHVVMNDNYCGIKIAHSIENALKNITKCIKCGSMSEHEICEVCLDDSRDNTKMCIVQSAKDIFIIEDSKQFDGKYFVIEELEQYALDSLTHFVDDNEVETILFANSSGSSGGTTVPTFAFSTIAFASPDRQNIVGVLVDRASKNFCGICLPSSLESL